MASATQDEVSSQATKEESGATTIRLLSAWYCPYAQRAWIAMLYKGIEFELVEAMDMQDGSDYKKMQLLLEKNPNGLVPTIVDQSGEAVYESHVCVEFADESNPLGPPLFPAGAVLRGRCRIMVDWANKHICSLFYAVLMKVSVEVKQKTLCSLRENLRIFSDQIVGPFFYGEQFSAVDVTVIPFVHRLYLLEVLSGPECTVDVESGEEWVALRTWQRAVEALEAVKATIPARERLIESYQAEARGGLSCQIEIAEMAGRQAHEI